MKRVLISALALSLLCGVGIVGCSDEASVKQEETVSGPGGTTTTTTEKSVESSGNNPPANSAGETAK